MTSPCPSAMKPHAHDFGPWLWDGHNVRWICSCRCAGCYEMDSVEAEYAHLVELGFQSGPDVSRAPEAAGHLHEWGPWTWEGSTASANCMTYRRSCNARGCFAQEHAVNHPDIPLDREIEFLGPDGNVLYWYDLIPIEELLMTGQLEDADPCGLESWDGTDGDEYASIE